VKFTVYRDADKQWRWRLTARNGKILADSGEGYRRRIDCNTAIQSIRGGAAKATIEVLADK